MEKGRGRGPDPWGLWCLDYVHVSGPTSPGWPSPTTERGSPARPGRAAFCVAKDVGASTGTWLPDLYELTM